MLIGCRGLSCVGFNGFRQISAEEGNTIFTPIQVRSKNSCAKSLIGASWEKTIFWTENDEIIVNGFYNEETSEKVCNIRFKNETIVGENVKAICADENNFFCLIKNGKLGWRPSGTADDFQMEEFAVEGQTLRDICLGGVSGSVYCLTGNHRLYSVRANLSISSIHLPGKVESISCGNNHCLALTDTGVIYSWGTGSRGQLGHGSLQDRQKPTLVDMLCGVNISKVSAGGWHSAALASTGDVYVWGWNESGQLGFPAVESGYSTTPPNDASNNTGDGASSPTPVAMLSSPALLELECYLKSDEGFHTVTDVSCGSRHSGAVLRDGRVLTWGWAKYGQLCQTCCNETESEKDCHGKRRKVHSSGADQRCYDRPHPPGLVDYFLKRNIVVTALQCVHWNTFFQVADDTRHGTQIL